LGAMISCISDHLSLLLQGLDLLWLQQQVRFYAAFDCPVAFLLSLA